MTQESGSLFDAHYYQTSCGRPYQRDEEWQRVFNSIAERINSDIHPQTVLDAGCAMGFLVEALRNLGTEAFGVDISEYAIQNAHASIQQYCRVGSISDPFPQMYDLIVTIEVLEHMPKDEAEKAVDNLCRYSNDIIFSSGNNDFREITHLNLQPPEYWASLFARNSFFRDVDFDATFVTPWAVRFRRQNEPVHRIVMGYERRIDRAIQENAAVRQVNLEQKNLLVYKDQEISKRDEEILSLKDQLSTKENEIALLHSQMEGIVNGRTYRTVDKLRLLIPPGSRREKLGLKIWGLLSSIRRR